MKDKTNAREETKAQERQFEDMADKTLENYEQALRMGLKLQEEGARWWGGIISQAGNAPDWQKQLSNLSNIATEVMPLAQERFEEVVDLVEKNSRTSAELVRKAVDVAQTPIGTQQQSKFLDLWTSSLGTMRTNVEALSEINSRAIDSYIAFVRRNTEGAEVRTPKAA